MQSRQLVLVSVLLFLCVENTLCGVSLVDNVRPTDSFQFFEVKVDDSRGHPLDAAPNRLCAPNLITGVCRIALVCLVALLAPSPSCLCCC